MRCPKCETDLTIDGSFAYEDVCCSSVRSWKHVCKNESCVCKGAFWNDSGEFFSGDLDFKKTREVFPEDKYAALDSISKKSEVEIYKRGLRDRYNLPAWLCFNKLKPYIEIIYKGNKQGKVLRRRYKLKFLRRDRNGGRFCIHHTPYHKMFAFKLRSFKRDLKNYKSNPSKRHKGISEYFEPLPEWKTKDAYRRHFHWYVNTFYRGLKKDLEMFK